MDFAKDQEGKIAVIYAPNHPRDFYVDAAPAKVITVNNIDVLLDPHAGSRISQSLSSHQRIYLRPDRETNFEFLNEFQSLVRAIEDQLSSEISCFDSFSPSRAIMNPEKEIRCHPATPLTMDRCQCLRNAKVEVSINRILGDSVLKEWTLRMECELLPY